MVQLETYQLRQMLTDAAELGAQRALEKVGVTPTTISKSEAYRLYGRAAVDRWATQGLITPIRDGLNKSRVRFDRQKLETVAKTSNRV